LLQDLVRDDKERRTTFCRHAELASTSNEIIVIADPESSAG